VPETYFESRFRAFRIIYGLGVLGLNFIPKVGVQVGSFTRTLYSVLGPKPLMHSEFSCISWNLNRSQLVCLPFYKRIQVLNPFYSTYLNFFFTFLSQPPPRRWSASSRMTWFSCRKETAFEEQFHTESILTAWFFISPCAWEKSLQQMKKLRTTTLLTRVFLVCKR
jgi:hypothetical protein